MEILKNEKYAVLPSRSTVSSYPSMMDIMEELAGEEASQALEPLTASYIYKITQKGLYHVCDGEAGFAELLPCGIAPYTLYRGQNEYYENSKPSLYRSYNEYEQLLSDMQVSELKILLDTHPILNYITKNSLHHPQISRPIRLRIHYLGLAQHYGIHTDLFDFTSDKWVAAFFATTRYIGRRYEPITGSDVSGKYGVLYVYDDFKKEEASNKIEALPIGMHYFNRPGMQSAYVLQMKEEQNLNELFGLRRIFFRHDAASSSFIYHKHWEGRSIFPEDSLADKVEALCAQTTFSLAASVDCKASHYIHLSDEEFQDLLDKYEIRIQPKPTIAFQEDVVEKEWHDWLNGGKERYMNTLVVIPVYKLGDK